MLVCTGPELVAWRPDFSSSGQASPRWTRVVCRGEQLTNALEDVDWLGDEVAVQVELCDACGYAGCASGGYVHVSRLGDHVLWTAPHVDETDSFEVHQYRPSDPVRRHGGVAIPVAQWTSWRARVGGLPTPDEFPPTLRGDLRSAWRAAAPVFGPHDAAESLARLAHERAVAADPSPLADALAAFDAVAAWLDADPDAAVEGALVGASDARGTIETLYFDVPDTFDRPVLREWTAVARVDRLASPLFGGELVLVPPPR